MTIYYFDPENGNNASAGTSFVTRKRSMQVGAPAFSSGDEARFISSPDPTSLGINATWTNKSATVTLASSLTQLITNCGTNWTPDTDVTSAVDTGIYREGASSIRLDIANAFTTGRTAYFPTGALNLSAYQQISFWLRSNIVLPANTVRINTYQNANGTAIRDSVDVTFAITPADRWVPITINTGGALDNNINSIGLHIINDPGVAYSIFLDNIIAVKSAASADSLSLTSLIGKNTGDETWWAIRSINGTLVVLDQCPTMTPSSTGRGYSGVTETVTTYKRETVKTDLSPSGGNRLTSNGSIGSPINVSGGWNRTDMSTQIGESWLDGRNCSVFGLELGGAYLTLTNIEVVRYTIGIALNSEYINATAIAGNNNSSSGIQVAGFYTNTSIKSASSNNVGVSIGGVIGDCKNINSNTFCGFTLGVKAKHTGVIIANNNASIGGIISRGRFGSITCNDNGQFGINIQNNYPVEIKSLSATGNSTAAVNLSAGTASCLDIKIYNLTTSSNGPAAPNDLAISNTTTTFGGDTYIFNANMAETIKINSITDYSGFRLYSHKEGGTVDNHIIRTDGATIRTELFSNRRTLFGMAWRVDITSLIRTVIYPVEFSIAKFAVNANKQVSFKAYLKKGHPTNIYCRILIPGGRISGIPVDVYSDALNVSAYHQRELVVLPTESGVIEVFLYAWSGISISDYVVIDDIIITQV